MDVFELHRDLIHDYADYTRSFTNVNNERTAIACVVPRIGIIQPLNAVSCPNADVALTVVGAVNSFAVDFVARQRFTGRHLNVTTFSQLPMPTNVSGEALSVAQQGVLELTYIAWDLKPFAHDCSYDGPPFRWDDERRFLVRCEVDAGYFHLYDIERNNVDYIMDTFPIVKRKDEQNHGEYRTKRVILEIYDEMARAIETGQPYQTRLNPPPGPPTDADGNFIPMADWDQSAWPPHIHPPREASEALRR